MSWTQQRADVVRRAVSIGIAVAIYGVSFGAMGVTSGFTVAQTQALSLLMFTGASQFALVSTVGAGGTSLAAIAAALLLGTRNAAYSLRLRSLLGVRGPARLLASHLTIDESTASALAPDSPAAGRLGFWSTGLSVFVFWNAATFLGAYTATAIGDPQALGLDAAIAAGLFALVWPQVKERQSLTVAWGGALLAILLTPVMPPGIPVLAAGAVAVIVGWSWRTRVGL